MGVYHQVHWAVYLRVDSDVDMIVSCRCTFGHAQCVLGSVLKADF